MEIDELFLRCGDASAQRDYVMLTPCSNGKRGAAVYHNYFSNEGEIKVRFEYLMEGGSGADGICVALVDPTHPKWLMSGDYGGGLGYNNRPGAVVGVGFDLWGNFGDGGSVGGHGGTLVVKGGETQDYATIAQLPFQVQTSGQQWRSVKIKFDLDDDVANISVKIDDEDIWEEVNVGQLRFPEQMAIAFTASTGGANNLHAIRNLQIKEEFEWDD